MAARGRTPGWAIFRRSVKADWNYDRAAHLLERAGFGGTPEEIEGLVKMTPKEAVQYLVYYQKVKNTEFAPFNASGIFPSDDFVPPLMGEHIRQALTTGEALGVKVERKPGTMWLQPIINASYFYRFANNGEIARVAAWFGQRIADDQTPASKKNLRSSGTAISRPTTTRCAITASSWRNGISTANTATATSEICCSASAAIRRC